MYTMKTASLWACCAALLLSGCPRPPDPDDAPGEGYRQAMRDFVQAIAAHSRNPATPNANLNFFVVPQNGQELITANGAANGPLAQAYVNAIDGQGREDLFYGYANDDIATPAGERNYMTAFLDRAEQAGVQAIVTDYCSTPSKMDGSYASNLAKGYVGFAADARELDRIPDYPAEPFQANDAAITGLEQAANFLYLISPDGAYASKAAFVAALDATYYDMFIVDLFYDGTALSAADLAQLKTKPNGARRIVLCYMSIGEAEDYRYYWQPGWNANPPDWLAAENPDWPGNYKVRYWMAAWQDVIFGAPGAYLDRILAAGFDGVYLDIIDAFEYFED